MSRKEKLPKHVYSFLDRHGRRRYQYKRHGKTISFKHRPTADEIAARLAASPTQQRYAPGSVGHTLALYCSSLAFTGRKSADTIRNARAILERGLAGLERDNVGDFRFNHIEALLKRIGDKRGPHAAINLRGELIPFFRYAEKMELISANPAEMADAPRAPKSKGFHAWTNEEIAQYRKHHELGTKARLALEIFLWTAQRKGDASVFGRKHIKDGWVNFGTSKTGKEIWLPLAPQLAAAIEAMTLVGTETFLVTDYGKPFSKAGLGNKMRQWCNDAGLPHCTAHGLRKATARSAAEGGATNQELKAVGGWSTDKEVGVYTASAEQKRMAEQAMRPVIEGDFS